MSRALATVLVLIPAFAAALACAADDVDTGRDDDAGSGVLATMSVRGRVVDVESCASAAGCVGVESAIVALAGAESEIHSSVTGADGAFRLDGVPKGLRLDLVALPQGALASRYAPTRHPMAIRPDDEELYALEVYMLPRDESSLLAAYERETGLDLVERGGFVGQVVRDSSGTVTAVADATVALHPPQGEVRFVNVLPRYVAGENAFLPSSADRTSGFGMFAVPAAAPVTVDTFVCVPLRDDLTFDAIVTTLSPGTVAFGLHVGR